MRSYHIAHLLDVHLQPGAIVMKLYYYCYGSKATMAFLVIHICIFIFLYEKKKKRDLYGDGRMAQSQEGLRLYHLSSTIGGKEQRAHVQRCRGRRWATHFLSAKPQTCAPMFPKGAFGLSAQRELGQRAQLVAKCFGKAVYLYTFPFWSPT